MRDSKNIWDEKFNHHSLEDEAWLEPAIDVFDNIAAEVYDTKGKRKNLVLLFLILGLLVSMSMLLLPTKDKNSESNSVRDSKVLNNTMSIFPTNSKAHNYQESNTNKSSDENSKETKVENELSPNEQNGSFSLAFNASEKEIKFDKYQIKSTNSFGINNNQISTQTVLNNKIVAEFQDVKGNVLRDTSNEEFTVGKNYAPNKQISKEVIVQIDLQKIETLKSTPLKTNRNEGGIFDLPKFIKPSSHTDNKFYLAFGANLEFWNFALNNNYSTALNPADFTHSSGKGASVNLNFGKKLFKRLHLVGGVSIQKINFTSGHNSTINYQLNQEVDGDNSNKFNLTMASPLGFLESDLIVQRTSAASTLSTDLILDLHNEHSITNLDINLGLDYNIVSVQNFSLSLGFKAGINKFLNVNNALNSFDINNSNFSSGANDIVKDQSNINTLTTYVGSTLNLEYNLSKNLSIGANVGYSMNLAPIYQENDFSTQLSRILSGFFVRVGF